jgi:predicted AlkP superfamily phosphohydrolase/phosphomutase
MKPKTHAEETLERILKYALNDDHMNVPYRKDDHLAMAQEVIEKMQTKLNRITYMCQDGLGN